MTDQLSRADAILAGEVHYFTGRTCPRGHTEKRRCSNGSCLGCERERSAAYSEGNRESVLARKRSWHLANRDRRLVEKRAYYEEHRDALLPKARQRAKTWHKANPDKVRAKRHNRRAAEGKHSAEDIQRILRDQKSRCPVCGAKLRAYNVDHIIPIARGGTNWPHNLQLLCPPCNNRKGAKDPIQFMQERGLLL